MEAHKSILEETDKDIIRGFALNTNSKAATQAKGFMYYFYDENLFDVSSSSSARIARTQNAPQEKNIWQSNNSTKFENDLLISPNPAKDFVNITLINSNQIVNIFDAQGKKVKTIQPEANSTRINLTDLEQGLYFVTFDKIRHKLIILR